MRGLRGIASLALFVASCSSAGTGELEFSDPDDLVERAELVQAPDAPSDVVAALNDRNAGPHVVVGQRLVVQFTGGPCLDAAARVEDHEPVVIVKVRVDEYGDCEDLGVTWLLLLTANSDGELLGRPIETRVSG